MALPSLKTRLAAAGLLAALLALTLGPKFALAERDRLADQDRFKHELAALFRSAGYRVSIVERRFQSDIVLARKGRCLVAARYGDNAAQEASEYRQYAGAIGPLRYVHGGSVSDAPPLLGPAVGTSAQRTFGRLGIRLARAPLMAVAAPEGCAPPPGFFANMRIYLRP